MKNKLLSGLFRFNSILILFSLLITFNLQAQPEANNTCLDCHDDPTITMDKNGKKFLLTVKKFTLPRSAHGKLKCVECHQGFNPDDIPHKEKIEAVNCMSCHKDIASKHVFHPFMKEKLAAAANSGDQSKMCKGCHGYHDITSPKTPGSKTSFINSTNFCGGCHEDKKKLHMESEHFVALNKNNPNAPTCIFCHSKPITEGYNLSLAQLKVNQEKLCLSCHLKNQEGKSTYANNLVNYEKSVHGSAITRGKKEAAVCVDCHGSHELKKRSDPTSRISQANVPNVCGKCHVSIAQEFSSSIHGIALKKGNTDVPGCTYCHGEHGISNVPEIPTQFFTSNHIKQSVINQNKMIYCIGCHDEKLMAKYNIASITKAHDWLPNKETHWVTLRCVDCHSSYVPPNLSHNILPPERTIKKCEECHSKSSVLMSKLYKHEKQQSREKFGFINGTLLSDAYVVGTTRNIVLDALSLIAFALVGTGIGLHGFLRWYFGRSARRKSKKIQNS